MLNETQKNDSSEIQKEMEVCNSFFVFVKKLFCNETNTHKQLDLQAVTEMIKLILKSVRNNHCNLMLALHKTGLIDENYIYSHTVRTAILSLLIGNDLRLPNHKLIELGVAALLHDIGMFSIPKELYLNSRALSEDELKIIHNHPIHSYKLLDSHNLSPAVKLAALEHHEREDGTGYPRKLTGEKISQYGKIIAVACSFDAISSKRAYKDSVDSHTGLINILKSKTKYNSVAVQALVNSLSIYPIGLYVLLSNEKQAQVVDVDPFDPRFPVVQLIGENSPDNVNIFQHTFQEGLFIVRPLEKDEIKEIEQIQ